MSEVINVHDFKTNYSRYLGEVKKGHTITVGERGVPVAELRPLAPKPLRRTPGTMKGKIWISKDFNDPLPEWDEALERDISEGVA